MNMAHMHLILNHLPIIAVPVALVFLIHAYWTNNFTSKKFAYVILIVAAGSVVPTYLTGEPAEEIVEQISGIPEALIESHEEAASVSLALTIFAGFAAIVGLISILRGWKEKFSSKFVLVTFLVAIASLVYTANLGGKIRHSELRGVPSGQEAPDAGHDE